MPSDLGFIFSSNRDENPIRPTLAPGYHFHRGQLQVYPKDEVAGGSWFGLDINLQKVACILNAQPREYPRQSKSRGKFLTKYISSPTSKNLFDYNGLAPFEFLSIEFGKNPVHISLHHWNGQELKCFEPDPSKPHIWSSLSLYSRSQHQINVEIFQKWLLSNQQVDQNKVIELQQTTFAQPLYSRNFHDYQQKYPIKTVSVTSFCADSVKQKNTLIYLELDSGRKVTRDFISA